MTTVSPSALITVTQECATCHGSGASQSRMICTACDDRWLSDQEVHEAQTAFERQLAARLPIGELNLPGCGHPRAFLEEREFCAECHSTGAITIRATVHELVDAAIGARDQRIAKALDELAAKISYPISSQSELREQIRKVVRIIREEK